MRYEITPETNEVRIFDTNDVEVVYQPSWPDGTNWASAAEATAWAEQHLQSMIDPSSELAGPSPDFPTVSRPTPPPPPAIPGVE